MGNLPAIWLLTALLAGSANAFELGFNQGWYSDHYGKSFEPGKFNEKELRQLFRYQKDLKAPIHRIWLFENPSRSMLNLDKDGKIVSLRPEFLTNLKRTLQIAKEEGIKLYPTLFDANVPNPAEKALYLAILNDTDGQGKAFREKILAPVLKLFEQEKKHVFGLDLVNEINAFVTRKRGQWFNGGWKGANKFVKEWTGFVHERSTIPVTTTVGWLKSEDLMLSGKFDHSPLDFLDVHIYDDKGNIRKCEKLVAMARKAGKKIYLGEFGHYKMVNDPQLQVTANTAFLENARRCGFDGAFGWRLSDDRTQKGLIDGKRHSFIDEGVKRPAYHAFKRFAESIQPGRERFGPPAPNSTHND